MRDWSPAPHGLLTTREVKIEALANQQLPYWDAKAATMLLKW